MVSFVEDEFHFTRQTAVLFVVFEDDVLEVHFHLHAAARFDALHGQAFEVTAQEFYVRFVHQFSFEGVAGAFFLHHMDVEGFYQQTDFASCLEGMVVLHHQLVAFARLHQHFIVYAFEDTAGYGARQLCGVGYIEDVDVFGANYYVHLHLFTKSRVYAFKFVPAEGNGLIFYHDSVQDVAFADEVGYKGVDGLVVDVGRHTYLLDASFAHHNDGVAQGECLFLVVGHVYEGDTQLLVHFLQFHLHVFAHFEVQGSERLVQQQHFGFVDDSSGDGYALLLSAGEGVHVAVLIVCHAHHAQGLFHFLLDSGTGQLLQLQPEGYVVEYVEVGEEGVLLEHGVHRTLVRRCLCDVLSGNGYHSFRGCLKACNEA